MNKNYIATGLALVLLVGTGIYWFTFNSSSKNYDDNRAGEERIEIIDGEEVVLETPLTESFSNAESNRKAKLATTNKPNNRYQSAKKAVVEVVTKSFFMGIYYAQTLRDNGFDACTSTGKEASEDDREFSEYLDTDKEVEFTKIEKILGQIFVYVQADSVPDKTCVRIIQPKESETIDSEPIHFIVE